MQKNDNKNLAKEMTDISMQHLEELVNLPGQISGTERNIWKVFARAKCLMQNKLAWINDPSYHKRRIALGMFITISIALLGGGQDPDGQWKTGG